MSIGTSSIIFPNVNLDDGCSVGAMSLFDKSTKSRIIYTGKPTKRIKGKDYLN
ncbi:hypothetical protein VCHA38O209_80174 [Vibrio chagasii]|nr:hypothetical protein VCHA38O209_80174 [Vibrio chagasii]